jgi:hypothetical protein
MVRITPQWDDLEINREKDGIASATLRYNILDVKDAAAADAALKDYADDYILGKLKRNTTKISKLAHDAYEGVIEYTKEEISEDEEEEGGEEGELNPDSYTFSFDTTGGTQHITQSYQTLGRYAAQGHTAPDHNGAIGVSDGEVTGCDIIVPQLSFTMSQSRRGVITLGYIKQLASITGKINNNYFLGFDIGELLFEGASGSQNYSGDEATFDLTYKFSALPNTQNLTIGNIVVSYKRGWDYMWVQYIETEDVNSKTMQKKPFAVYVERVYQEANFNLLR